MGRPLIHKSPMPGLGLSMGITMTMLSLVVLLPIGALLLKGASFGIGNIWEVVNRERVWSALFLSFRLSLFAALFNLVFGVLLAWVLVRYRFPGRRILDAAVDLPFALPTAVAGISLTTLYAPNGAFGSIAAEAGWRIAYTQWGILIALIFVGLPFVTRTVQPVVEEIEREVEEASATLGASRLYTIRHVILPMLTPAALTGFALALARAVGEYGSVIFIAGNIPLVTEIAPLLIVIQLEEFNYDAAASIGIAMLLISFAMLLAINLIQVWSRRRIGHVDAPAITFRAPTQEAPLARWMMIGIAALGLGILVGAPLVVVFAEALAKGWGAAIASLTNPDARSAIRLTLMIAAISVPLNAVFGIAAAWFITKFDFRGKAFLITLIDLPFSVSPVVAGLCIVLLFGANSLIGGWMVAQGLPIVFAVPGIVLATLFVTFPFVARELIPVMIEQGRAEEEAALTLGASGWRVFWTVTLPNIRWALLYGVLLCNARAMGEFGAVAVVSGKIRGQTATMPITIEMLYNEYLSVAAFSLAALLTLLGLLTLVLKIMLERRHAEQLAANHRH